jgi:hypothetical protein
MADESCVAAGFYRIVGIGRGRCIGADRARRSCRQADNSREGFVAARRVAPPGHARRKRYPPKKSKRQIGRQRGRDQACTGCRSRNCETGAGSAAQFDPGHSASWDAWRSARSRAKIGIGRRLGFSQFQASDSARRMPQLRLHHSPKQAFGPPSSSTGGCYDQQNHRQRREYQLAQLHEQLTLELAILSEQKTAKVIQLVPPG